SLALTSDKQLVFKKNASAKPLQPSKQINQAPLDKKRPREDEKDAKDAPKKRRQVEQPLQVKQARGEQTKLNFVDSKLAVGPIMTIEQPTKKVATQKPPQQPLWTRVGVDFSRFEIEDRIM
ncbi:6205_t:CDS:2, partial [Acaulospora colombiana]